MIMFGIFKASRAIAVACFLVATHASAEEDVDYARTGAHVGGGVAFGIKTLYRAETSPFKVDNDLAAGFSASAGYRFYRYMAAEGQFTILGGTSLVAPLPDSDLDVNVDVMMLSYTVNLKGYLATGRVQPFLLAGMGALTVIADGSVGTGPSVSVAATEFAGRFGGGIEFYLSPEVVLQIGVSYMLVVDRELDYVEGLIGFQRRF